MAYGAVNPFAPQAGLGSKLGLGSNPFFQGLRSAGIPNLLTDLGTGLMTGRNWQEGLSRGFERNAQMAPYRQEQQQRQEEIARLAQLQQDYAKLLRGWGPEFEDMASAVEMGAIQPAEAWKTAMQMRTSDQQEQEQLERDRANAMFLQDPQLKQMVEAGALDFASAYEMERTGQKAPQIVEIFDPETGQPQKGYMMGGEFIPVGGAKAPTQGQSFSYDPSTGDFTFNQGGTAAPPGGMSFDPTRNPGHLGKKLSEADAKLLEGYREAATAADDLSATVDGLEMVIGNVGYTGPGGEIYGAVDDVVGVLPGDSGSRGAAKSLAMEAQLSMTAKTKGAITDREMGMFKQAVPGLGQTAEGNQQIIAAMRAMTNRVKTRAVFMEQYANVNGSMNGAQQAWNAYIQENPVLEGSAGRLVVREEGDFTPYLQRGGSSQAPKPGHVEDGFVFNGGDPADPASWSPVGAGR
jgi:hypothetical protein